MITRRAFLTGSITVTMLGSPLFSVFAEKRKKRNLRKTKLDSPISFGKKCLKKNGQSKSEYTQRRNH